MASTSVNLTKIKRGKGTVYQIDYRINRKRIREVVGPDRRTAELKRATTGIRTGTNGLARMFPCPKQEHQGRKGGIRISEKETRRNRPTG
jgi:hypothetical protein